MITVSKKGFPRKLEVDRKILRMIHKKTVIYCFYFLDSEKMYFGQTEDFWQRMSGYRTSIKTGILEKHQPKLYNAINLYDYNFTITIVAIDVNIDDLDDVETAYIDIFDSFKNGYNGTGGGKVLRGEKSPMFGKKHSEETKKLMSESRMGDPRPKSEEWCREHSKRMKGENNPNFGGLSDEHRLNLSISKIETGVQKYKDIGIDISEENIRAILLKNNNNMRQTTIDIGCADGIVRNFCIRHRIDITDNMTGENNPKRKHSIQKHAERGIDISAENIKKIFEEQDKNIAKTAKKIGCRWQVIKSFCDRNNMIQKT
ncbi:GIY-YIG catalytic domain-containing endonuclease [Paramecium bursaria Chlorella virus NE-JV-1]|nr:GIY-YIG catalytic domain-containing endonuclease [Paramecium bursaria Chlorella virus NE-JV-1]